MCFVSQYSITRFWSVLNVMKRKRKESLAADDTMMCVVDMCSLSLSYVFLLVLGISSF